MAKHVAWDRDQQLIALRLYMGTQFGKLHGRNPEIVALADQIGRTPSALAMKACNFASLDPVFRQTNRQGLSGASTADAALWMEFVANPEAIAAEAEEAFSRIDPSDPPHDEPEFRIPAGDTETSRLVRARRVQTFFRVSVLNFYAGRCAISGLCEPSLLVASHIIPWSVSVPRRADPTNGLCLNALFDRAFDRGLITFDPDLRVVVSKRLKKSAEKATLACSLIDAEGKSLNAPRRFPPATDALEYHRSNVFRD